MMKLSGVAVCFLRAFYGAFMAVCEAVFEGWWVGRWTVGRESRKGAWARCGRRHRGRCAVN